VTVTAQLYTAGVGGSVLAPVAATLCNAAPTLTGIVPAGTQVQFSCNALSVPVSGGSTATIAIRASNPFPGTTVVPLQTTIGLKGS
jgi:hypothetical protein